MDFKNMKNPLKYIKHIVKDPVKTIAEADARKEEIMPLFYGSSGALAVGLILQVVVQLEFMAFLSFIGLAGTAFSAFLLNVLKTTKRRFEALTCNNCDTLAEFNTVEAFGKYISYCVEENIAIYKGEGKKCSPTNGVYSLVKITATSSAVVSVDFTCPHCGDVKRLRYKAIPFKCHAEQKDVRVIDYEIVRDRLEAVVRAAVNDYNNDEKRNHVPYSFHSSKNPNFADRFNFKGANAKDAHPDYMGARIDYHKDVEEMLEHYFVLNELNGILSDPSPSAKKKKSNGGIKASLLNFVKKNTEKYKPKQSENSQDPDIHQNAVNTSDASQSNPHPADQSGENGGQNSQAAGQVNVPHSVPSEFMPAEKRAHPIKEAAVEAVPEHSPSGTGVPYHNPVAVEVPRNEPVNVVNATEAHYQSSAMPERSAPPAQTAAVIREHPAYSPAGTGVPYHNPVAVEAPRNEPVNVVNAPEVHFQSSAIPVRNDPPAQTAAVIREHPAYSPAETGVPYHNPVAVEVPRNEPVNVVNAPEAHFQSSEMPVTKPSAVTKEPYEHAPSGTGVPYQKPAAPEMPQKERPNSEDVRIKKPKRRNGRKVVLIIIILCAALLLGGLAYVLFGNEHSKDSPTTETKDPASSQGKVDKPEEPTDHAAEQVEKFSINDYVGYWGIKGNPNKELTIHSGDGDTVYFSLWYATQGKISNATAQLQNNVASFSLATDGAVVKGTLTFENNAITLEITKSSLPMMPMETMEFTEQYMTSQAYDTQDPETSEDTEQEEDEDIPDENLPMNECPYLLTVKTEYHLIYVGPFYDSGYVQKLPTGTYTITEEMYDEDNNLWGRLKSGAGWICLTDVNSTENLHEYILPFSSKRLMVHEEVYLLTQDELIIAINEIFARHGRLFSDPGLQAYFNSKSWYWGYIPPENFSDSVLSDIERTNINLLLWYREQANSNDSWNEAYIDYIESNIDMKRYCEYSLVYVDDDDIPELFISGASEADGSYICSYKDGQVIEQNLMRLYGAYYIPESGLVCNRNGSMGCYYTDIYLLDDEGFSTLLNGLYEQMYYVGENGVEYSIVEHYISGNKVSGEEYETAIARHFDFSVAARLDEYLVSYEQIISDLGNW